MPPTYQLNTASIVAFSEQIYRLINERMRVEAKIRASEKFKQQYTTIKGTQNYRGTQDACYTVPNQRSYRWRASECLDAPWRQFFTQIKRTELRLYQHYARNTAHMYLGAL